MYISQRSYTTAFLIVLLAMPYGVLHAGVVCTGMGDNQLTMTGGGVSVACSKYETPGGGATKFQMPDGTMCSFQNTKPNDVSCGSQKGAKNKVPPVHLSQDAFRGLFNDVNSAYQSGVSPSDIAMLIQDALLKKGRIDDGGILESAFTPLDAADAAVVSAPVENFDSVYKALLNIAKNDVPKSSTRLRPSVPADMQFLDDTQPWAITMATPEEDAPPGPKPYLGRFLGVDAPVFYAAESRPVIPAPCYVLCQVSRAWRRGAVSWFDFAFPLASAAAAGWLARIAWRQTFERDEVPNRVA